MIGAHLSELFERKLKNSENNRWISTVQTYQLHQLLLPRRYLYKTNFYFATLLDNRRLPTCSRSSQTRQDFQNFQLKHPRSSIFASSNLNPSLFIQTRNNDKHTLVDGVAIVERQQGDKARV